MTDDKQLAQLAGEFLKRVDLKGSEVPAFIAVTQWLMGMTGGGVILPPQPDDNPEPHGNEEPS